MTTRFILPFVFLYILFIPAKGLAQNSSVRGVVKDFETSDILFGVTVSLRSMNGLEVASAKTDLNFGEFEIDSIPMGEYRLELWKNGYKTKQLDNFVIGSNEVFVKNVKLVKEFNRFSVSKNQTFIDPISTDEDQMSSYLLYSGLTMVLLASFALK